MALRSVVVDPPASPAGPRRTVVLRAGAPAPKGRATDIVVGLIGLLLLVATIGLAWYLPDRTYLNPQFRLSFPETIVGDLGSQRHDFVEGDEPFDFPFEVTDGNVKTITVQIGFEDDLPFSQPDAFEVELLGPSGESFFKESFANDPPREGSSPEADPTFTVVDEILSVPVAPTPTEQIVGGLRHDEAPEQALARLEPDYRVDNSGTWTLRVRLLYAGDCPNPGDEGSYPSQGFHCVFGPPTNLGTPSGASPQADPGNVFFLVNAGYTFYTPTIQELS